jgi:hypothetical protein
MLNPARVDTFSITGDYFYSTHALAFNELAEKLKLK